MNLEKLRTEIRDGFKSLNRRLDTFDVRQRAIEVKAAEYGVKIDGLEKDTANLWGKVRAGHAPDGHGAGGVGKLLAVITFLAELPMAMQVLGGLSLVALTAISLAIKQLIALGTGHGH